MRKFWREGVVPLDGALPDALNANFVNTGINVIQGAQFYFDAKLGQIGFSTV
jgi:hypothetical protein